MSAPRILEGRTRGRKRKQNELPQSSIALHDPGQAACTVGVITIAALATLNIATHSQDVLDQYRSFTTHGHSVNPSDYVVWTIAGCFQYAEPITLRRSDLRHAGALVSSTALTEDGLERILAQNVFVAREEVSIANLFANSPLRTWQLPKFIQNTLSYCSLPYWVTPRTYADYAGLHVEPCAPCRSLIQGQPRVEPTCDPIDDDTNQYHYPFEVTIAAMRLGRLLRHVDNIKEAVKASLKMSLPGDAADLMCSAIDKHEVRFPLRNAVNKGWQKLDCIDVLWERQVNPLFSHCRFLMGDLSPKAFNYFCVRERDIMFPENGHPFHTLRTVDHQAISRDFVDHAWQATVLGYGAGGIEYKLRNILHSMPLRAGTEYELDQLRKSVLGWTSDQGTERKLADVAFAHPPSMDECKRVAAAVKADDIALLDSAARDRYLWPNALYMPGHIHMLMNGLQETVENSVFWGSDFTSGLRGTLSMLNSKPLRTRMVATCMSRAPPSEQRLFKHWSTQHLDWRWESLGLVMTALILVIDCLLAWWDLDKMMHGEGNRLSTIDAACVQEAGKFPARRWLKATLELLRVMSVVVNKWASWLEGCACHEDIWTGPGSYEQKKKMLYERYGIHKCAFKGCRGPEMAAGGVDMWMDRLRNATSEELDLQIHRLGAREASELVALLHAMKESLVEIYMAKFDMYKHLPYIPLGLKAADLTAAKRCARIGGSEYSGCAFKDRVHRVAQRIFASPVLARQLEEFGQGNQRLEEFPELFNIITMYILISLVERQIEGEHAKIEQATLMARNIDAPLICARVRSPQLLTGLDNKTYYAYAKSQGQVHVFRKMLEPALHKDSLRGLDRHGMLEKIYLCGQAEQFSDTSSAKQTIKDWEGGRYHALVPLEKPLAREANLCEEWWKKRLVAGRLFAIDRQHFHVFDYAGSETEAPMGNPPPLADLLQLCGCDEMVAELPTLSSLQFFKIVNPRPRARLVQQPWHLGGKPNVIRVVEYDHDASHHDGTLLVPTTRIKNLDLNALCSAQFLEVVQHFWSFTSIEPGARLAIRHDVQQMLTEAFMTGPPMLEETDGQPSALSLYNAASNQSCAMQIVKATAAQGCIAETKTFMDATQHWPAHVVHELVRLGVASSKTTETGALVVAVSMRALCHLPLLRCREPVLEICALDATSNIMSLSRLDMITILHRQGFHHDRATPLSWKPGGDSQYRYQSILGGSKFYFACLIQREAILAKGATEILHVAPASYYRCLLGLTAVANVQALVDSGSVNHSACQSLLDAAGVPSEAAVAESSYMPLMDADAGGLDEIQDSCPVNTEVFAAEKALLKPYILPETPWFGQAVVHFDNCSHSSGHLRGYIRCSWGHPNCYKYQQVNVAGCREWCIAFLHAWNLWGEGRTREQHTGQANVPPEGLVQQQYQMLFG